MKSNPILEEVWRIKEELSRVAGDDIHQLCGNARKGATDSGRPNIRIRGRVVNSAKELRQFATEAARQRAQASSLELKDEAPYPKT